MKSKRHAKIIELITDHPIDTQEELLNQLNEAGFKVTQATISLDIKELRLVNAQSSDGRYRYTTSSKESVPNKANKFNTIFAESVTHVDYAGNIVVIKCYVGMANAVCILLDSLHWKGIVGTVSGDDTIFLLVRTENDAVDLARQLTKLLNK